MVALIWTDNVTYVGTHHTWREGGSRIMGGYDGDVGASKQACSLPSTLEIRAMKTGSTGFRTELQRRFFEDFGGGPLRLDP